MKQKILSALFFLFCFQYLSAQELFVYTEPASNMAAKSIGLRLNNYLLKEWVMDRYDYQVKPEIMCGVSKKTMIHAEGFFSNNEKKFKADGASLYIKYRFYSRDEVHSHFRVAAYVKGAFNNSAIHQPAIDLNGYNSGYETGLVATRLINKLALSVGSSFLHATDNTGDNKFPYEAKNRNAVSYSFSAGKLLLPEIYKDYKQINLNAMIEVLGQMNLKSAKNYLDIAPSLQFIFLSKMRLDIGYRFAIIKDLLRNAENGFLIRFEYNFFNVYK